MTANINEEPMLRFFRYEHLSEGALRVMSAQFASLAFVVVDSLPPSPERTKALNELKIAKDWAVCAVVDVLSGHGSPPGPNRPDPAFSRVEDPGVPGGVPAGRVCVCGASETAVRHVDPSSDDYHEFEPCP